MLGNVIFDICCLTWAPREPSEHYVGELANRRRLFTKKEVLGLIVAPF